MTDLVSSYNDQLSVAKVTVSTATTVTPVAAATGQQVQVYKVVLTSTAAQTVDFQDNTTSFVAPFSLAAGVPFILPFDGQPWFTTTAGNALKVVTSAATQTTMLIYYLQKNGPSNQ